MMRTIAFVCPQSRTGRTTVSLHLATALVRSKKRVLLVDASPNPDATRSACSPEVVQHGTLVDVLEGKLDISSAIIHAAPGYRFDILPGTCQLLSYNDKQYDDYSILKRALCEIEDQYDFTLIDCPCNIAGILKTVFAAAPEILVPLSFWGTYEITLKTFETEIAYAKKRLGVDLPIVGILLSVADTLSSYRIAEYFRGRYGNLVFDTVRCSSDDSANRNPLRTSVMAYRPSSKGAKDYIALADEVIRRGGRQFLPDDILSAALEWL